MDRIHGSVPRATGTSIFPFQVNAGPPAPVQDPIRAMASSLNYDSRTGTKYSPAELISIKKLFPWVEEVEESLIHMIPLHKFSEMTPKPPKQDTSRQGLRDRLMSNSKKLVNPSHSGSHSDDSFTQLCPVRVDRYPRTSVQEFISTAKKILPRGGVPPVDGYDLDFLGLGGTVTDRGWVEVHNPGSEFLNLKMFSKANSYSASEGSRTSFSILSSGDAIGIGDCLKDIVSMAEFKQALRSYVAASYFALPWYPAPQALVNFLEHHRYMEAYIPSNQASTLTRFVNAVMYKNAKSWRTTDIPPLSVEDLFRTWSHFTADASGSPADFNARFTPDRQSRRDFSKRTIVNPPSLFPKASQLTSFPRQSSPPATSGSSDVCIRFNLGICPSQRNSSCILTYKSGRARTLQHTCDRCGKYHASSQFHKKR